ncbi:hypothetical protein [Mesorhizobium sp. M0140]|uniref:hypothetical protein n=1 Tax=Mesorhizobium sp. M0140 TaxID=2956893 RepID=UPI00333AFBDD
MPGIGVAEVARKYGVTWQVYDWRKRLRHGSVTLPESMAAAPAFAALLIEEPSPPRQASAGIDVILGNIAIRAGQDADDRHLSRAIRAVRRPRYDHAWCAAEGLRGDAADRLS